LEDLVSGAGAESGAGFSTSFSVDADDDGGSATRRTPSRPSSGSKQLADIMEKRE
jgi:hypothetical protein